MKHLIRFLALVLVTLAPQARVTAADPIEVPSTIDYQGLIYDPGGAAFSPGVATNYTIQFRIWNALTGGTLVWAESQLVTVKDGQFSVRLGEGQPIAGEPGTVGHANLAAAFNGKNSDGKSRFLGVTVVIPNQGLGEISPRLAFLTGPFSFLAGRAFSADTAAVAEVARNVTQTTGQASFAKASFDDASATTLKATTLTATTPDKKGKITADAFAGDGAGLTGLDASRIATGTLNDALIPAGVVRANGSTRFTGANTFESTQNVFNGNGGGLKGLNASELSSGTVSESRLPPSVIVGSLNGRPLLLKSNGDTNHQLIYGFDNWGMDGPVLAGYGGGILGVKDGENRRPSLRWGDAGVFITNDLTLQNRLVVHKPGWTSGWAFTQASMAGFPEKQGNELRLACDETSSAWFRWQSNGQQTWTSDLRAKKDVSTLEPVLDSVLKLRPVRYRLKDRPETEAKVVGFIAQEVQPLFPGSVSTAADGLLSLAYTDFGVYAVKALQELARETRAQAAASTAEITSLRRENEALRDALQGLQDRLEALEARTR